MRDILAQTLSLSCTSPFRMMPREAPTSSWEASWKKRLDEICHSVNLEEDCADMRVLAGCLSPEEDDLLAYLRRKHVATHCHDRLSADKLLERLRFVVEHAATTVTPPAALRLVHEQMKKKVTRIVDYEAGSLFLRKLFYFFAYFDYLCQYLVDELADSPKLCDYCCDSEKRWLILTLLDHRTNNSEAYTVSHLQERILSWKNLDRLITSKSGGLWILRRVMAKRKDLHAKVASWLIFVPWKYESSMSVDVVAQMFEDSPQSLPVKKLATAYLNRALQKEDEYPPLLYNCKFWPALKALYAMGGEYSAQIDAKYNQVAIQAFYEMTYVHGIQEIPELKLSYDRDNEASVKWEGEHSFSAYSDALSNFQQDEDCLPPVEFWKDECLQYYSEDVCSPCSDADSQCSATGSVSSL